MDESSFDMLHNSNHDTLSCNTFCTPPRCKVKQKNLICSGDIEDDEYNLSSSLNHGLFSYLHFDGTSYKPKINYQLNTKTARFTQLSKKSDYEFSLMDKLHSTKIVLVVGYDLMHKKLVRVVMYNNSEAWKYGPNSHCHVDSGIRKKKVEASFPNS
ncbi:uncharacterized protein EV154DRAFT_476359 [Mucor mucedo]|uniref:uncharacterized protein n=1 Tax=Mucor mucedo TaxID=29922 RepID=UPI00221ED42C|nr:uncharacterized protein EV154DRAFT_476359 [Mucor mucedo]KAI7896722.1 hypothetical protein EV154DRAFT_476359 [Mucor mucedo]